ncbi:MAG: chemotaxis-specific protein-glutamate methyltransferase CheB [Chloroflexota bacterium]
MTGPITEPDQHRDHIAPASVRRVLIAEDSATLRYHLKQIIDETPGLEVIAQARDGEEAIQLTAELRPDVVSMDIRMPHIDGLAATRHIMAHVPTPVVIVSNLVETDIQLSFVAVEAGALAVVAKPPARSDPDFHSHRLNLVRTLLAMSEVSVVRRGPKAENVKLDTGLLRMTTARPEVVVIGASAGGPRALGELLAEMPAALSVPIVIAQHMPHEFVPGLVRWLDKLSPLDVVIAADRQQLQPGVVHVAPGDHHITVKRSGTQLITQLIAEQGDQLHQPSVDVLFRSAAVACGANAIGIILTGMGNDGAAGLLEMANNGAYTVAQDEATSIVFGMPRAAIMQGAARRTLPLAQIPSVIRKLV